ncbi:MAG TPA: hypothetical protein PLR22_02680 [Saprospiraceae bacterium]|nr:hypothetical protein [Saprospiraceae bacterium]
MTRLACYNIVFLFLLSFMMTSCEKEEPVNPDTPKEDTTFSFKCSIEDIPWDGSKKALANPQIKLLFPKVDSLPQAFFSGDTLLIGVGGKYNNYDATLLMAIRVANKADLKGTYNFAHKIGSLEVGKGIGVFDGSSTDLLTYATGLDLLEYVDDSKVIITEHKNGRISGTFQFRMEHIISKQGFNAVKEGTFKNFKIKQ